MHPINKPTDGLFIGCIMSRIVKEVDYIQRRNEILDAAQRLVYTVGYNQMSIQDILEDCHISKGAFYHYFDSKGALLEALIERMIDEAVLVLQPIVEDPHLPALEKLSRYFTDAGRWKVTQKSFVLEILRVWYADENALARQKASAAGLQRITPMIETILQQGKSERIFDIPCVDRLGEVSLSLMYSMGDTMARMLLERNPDPGALERMMDLVETYTRALERVLGAPSNSIVLVEPDILKEWFEVIKEVQV
jgi:AcrR family transcriptional regulator